MNTIAGFAGNGTIGYVEYSYPLNKDYPVVKVLNKAGYYVEPTQYNVAVALTKAKINQDTSSQLYLTQILDGVYTNTDPRAYPLSSYSYMIIPTGADRPADDDGEAADARRLHVLLAVRGPDQGRPVRLLAAAAQPGAGRLRPDRQAQGGRPGGRPHRPRRHARATTRRSTARTSSKNQLAQIAPQPAACDKDGEGPCGTDTGTNEPSTDDASAPAPTPRPAPGTAPAAGGGTAAPGGGGPTGAVRPATPRRRGADAGDPATGGGRPAATADRQPGGAIYADPTELAAVRAGRHRRRSAGSPRCVLLALVLLPGLLRRRSSRAHAAGARR